ncbi:uncharacterized protein CELE_T07A5.1 [Caenorhabditis elegans]|uniref:Uncharacterized protein T07A5.1 n=1 Tax=Caenorhabditis elegans TaxID=6239 RepID=YRT1_CAEEL|nr:Uncharacterized protein CELE_T07A5.1 [Caenorhabditis elegans]Q10044.2 RecName: Full=Uncharacterized protein T07A5.1 [Caenorhabditis elegans]CAA88133.2 Uncharacterized protein CELE_T07A5.1 [Caenorhabditis elegans]|eukprot:NP_499278.2 Uncharacterized protein CELE_T07A5.1 [Caenorhabditis elegans]
MNPRLRVYIFAGIFLFIALIILIKIFFEEEKFDVLVVSLDSKEKTSKECLSNLQSVSIPVPALIIDKTVLKAIYQENCEHIFERKIKIGIDKRNWKLIANHNESSIFECIRMENKTSNDYLQFDTQPARAVLKNFNTFSIGNLHIPSNIPLFLKMWERSEIRGCLNLIVHRNMTKSQQFNHGKEAAEKLAEFRDVLLTFNMFAFLNGGTLLGWYRECGFIPHTADIDLAMFAEDFHPEITHFLLSRTSSFQLLRSLGMLNDSYELTVTPKTGYIVNMDLFLMYKDVHKNGSVINWVGGASNDIKYKYTYPAYDPWCAADLHGHLFWVTCSPQKMLVFEYGNLWYEDHPSSQYDWRSTAKNVRTNGLWSDVELKNVSKLY